ncbi:hypothetical protein NLG97_g2894 [Lecanicillium saksenae]|uniref:Uncharacterized protein n=1 Tax=Lecanicillium saksenae TaxID=468837 RepID=A0ACC1QZL0_9HYPO|nr:hypothetical protein NLG97_g2894 [Lecanicillium saksenae]
MAPTVTTCFTFVLPARAASTQLGKSRSHIPTVLQRPREPSDAANWEEFALQSLSSTAVRLDNFYPSPVSLSPADCDAYLFEVSCDLFAGDMDEQNQGRRYSQHTLNGSQGTRYTSLGSSTSHPNVLSDVSPDRYRNGSQLGLPVSARTLGNSVGADGQYYSDQITTFPGPTSLLTETQMSYDSDYDSNSAGAGGREQQHQQQTPGFGSYHASLMMYSVPQTGAQTSIYNTSQYPTSHPSRSNPMTSTSLLSDQTDVNQSYFGAHVPGVSSATASLDQASTAAYYQDLPTSFPYAGGAGSGGSAGSGSGSGSGTSGLTGVESFYHLADLGAGNAATMAETSGTDKAAEFEEKWQDYQRRLASVFKEITEGNLERAADGLLSVSFWLLSRVEELGLTDDDETLQKDRLKLWQDFNHAWIGLIFKQKQYMLQDSHDDSLPQPLSMRTIKRMGDELIRLCDGIERHGLVDYQFGVWEDEIETLLEDCLTLFEENEKEAPSESNRNG